MFQALTLLIIRRSTS